MVKGAPEKLACKKMSYFRQLKVNEVVETIAL